MAPVSRPGAAALEAPSPARLATIPWRTAAGVGATVLLATSTGDLLVVAALVGVALGAWAGAAFAGAGVAAVVRFGTSDLGALAGDQAVLGPAVTVEPAGGAASSGVAAAAVLLAAGAAGARPDRSRWAAVVAGGLGAGVVACGPSAVTAVDAGLRAGAAAAGLLLALLLTWRPLGGRVPAWLGAAVGAAAVVVAVAG